MPRTGHVTPGWAHVVVTVTYLVGFTVVDFLSDGLAVLGVVIAIGLLNLEAPTWWRQGGRESRWRSEARAFGLATVCIAVGLGTSSILLDMPAYPRGGGRQGGLVATLAVERLASVSRPDIWTWWPSASTAGSLRGEAPWPNCRRMARYHLEPQISRPRSEQSPPSPASGEQHRR